MKAFVDYRNLTLNGVTLAGSEIITFCENQGPGVFHDVAHFIKEWFQPEPRIKVRTSGSTGKPKTLWVEKDKMLKSASRTARYFDFRAGQTALLCLPVNYIAGKMMIVRALFSQLNLLCIDPAVDPLAVLPSEVTIDFAAMIPMQLQQVKDRPALSKIKNILLGGGPVSTDLEKAVGNLPTQVFHGYGMTETLSHIAIRKLGSHALAAEYHVLNGISITQDSRSCLVIMAPDLPDTPVRTNDVVTLTGENKFIWKGRFDNVVNSGGIKLQPEELEKKLQPLLHSRFFLAGIKDDVFGEKLVLILEDSPWREGEIKKLKSDMTNLLDKYELPKAIYFAPVFKETSNGKINRSATVKSLGSFE